MGFIARAKFRQMLRLLDTRTEDTENWSGISKGWRPYDYLSRPHCDRMRARIHSAKARA